MLHVKINLQKKLDLQFGWILKNNNKMIVDLQIQITATVVVKMRFNELLNLPYVNKTINCGFPLLQYLHTDRRLKKKIKMLTYSKRQDLSVPFPSGVVGCSCWPMKDI